MYVTLQSSTCFEYQHAHLQEDKLYYPSIWYRHSLYSTVQYSTLCRMRADCLWKLQLWLGTVEGSVQPSEWTWNYVDLAIFHLHAALYINGRQIQYCFNKKELFIPELSTSLNTVLGRIYKEPTWCNLAVCLLVTAIILYMFRTLFASILRST
jgi:hypothetical protein